MGHRLLERFPQLRRVTNTTVVQRCLAAARRVPHVKDPVGFLWGELLAGGTRVHRLAADPRRVVVVRHKTPDMGVFDEIFFPPCPYTPPATAAAALKQIVASRPLRVLDLGANIGLFAVDALVRCPSAEVTSYEPDPENLAVLRRCIDKNKALDPTLDWTLVEACATATNESVRITAGNFSHTEIADEGLQVPGVDVLPIFGDFDYVKMDIEGSEWPILMDARWADAMRNVAVFVIEWHDGGGRSREDAIVAVKAAGFTINVDHGRAHGLIWGWR